MILMEIGVKSWISLFYNVKYSSWCPKFAAFVPHKVSAQKEGEIVLYYSPNAPKEEKYQAKNHQIFFFRQDKTLWSVLQILVQFQCFSGSRPWLFQYIHTYMQVVFHS